MRKTILYILFLFCSLTVYSQQDQGDNAAPKLVTDRPDATESPRTVPQGFLQVETGSFYTSFEVGGVEEEVIALNTTLLRIGLLDNLELRLGWNFEEGRTRINNMEVDNVTSGFSPLLAGVKVNITEEKGLLPEIGLIGHVFLPFTAGSDYRPETTGIDFRFSMAHSISDKSILSYNIGAQWGNDSPEAAYIYTLSYAYSFTRRLGMYAELYGDFPEDNSANHLWDAGVTYLVCDNIQLDATVGTSITEGQDLLLSGGVSFRIPR